MYELGRNNQYAVVLIYLQDDPRLHYGTTTDSRGKCNYTKCIVNVLGGMNENNMKRNYKEQ